MYRASAALRPELILPDGFVEVHVYGFLEIVRRSAAVPVCPSLRAREALITTDRALITFPFSGSATVAGAPSHSALRDIKRPSA